MTQMGSPRRPSITEGAEEEGVRPHRSLSFQMMADQMRNVQQSSGAPLQKDVCGRFVKDRLFFSSRGSESLCCGAFYLTLTVVLGYEVLADVFALACTYIHTQVLPQHFLLQFQLPVMTCLMLVFFFTSNIHLCLWLIPIILLLGIINSLDNQSKHSGVSIVS